MKQLSDSSLSYDISRVTGQRAVMLATFRRSGAAVRTPVGYGVEGNALFFMTDSTAGKVKRLRHDPRVTVAAATLRGQVRGPELGGRATELTGPDAERAIALITAHNRLAWFFLLRRARRRGRIWSVYGVELDPAHSRTEGTDERPRTTEPVTTEPVATDYQKGESPMSSHSSTDRSQASVDTSAPDRRDRAPVASIVFVVFALGQFVSALCSALFGGSFTTADRAGEPSIVPPGYTFSIWGVIELLSAAYAVWALWRRGRLVEAERSPQNDRQIALIDRLAVPFAVVTAGFSVWLVAAEVEPTWSTLAVFLVMGVALFIALERALAGSVVIAEWPVAGRLLLWGCLGLYAGWSSIAIWLNLTTGLVGSGAPITGTAGVWGQLAILVGATATAAAVLRWTRGLLPYAATVVWALIGASIGANGAGEPLLAIASMVGAGMVVVITVVERLRRRQTTRAAVAGVAPQTV